MKWISDQYLELTLQAIAESDTETICTQQPLSYFEACKGDIHQLNTAYALGDVVRPGTPNGYVYECVTAGDSDSTEPPWSTTPDDTFMDNTVEWKVHNNYCIASSPLDPADLTIGDGASSGRSLTVAQKIGVITHASGDVTHTALLKSSDLTLRAVTDAETTLSGDNFVEAGRTTIFFPFTITIPDPV